MAEVPQPLFPEVLAEFTYLKPEQDAQLRGKLDTITKQVTFAAYGASNNLDRSYFGQQVRLVTSGDGVLYLPPPTLADVGKGLVLNHYSGAGPSAVLSLQAVLGKDTSPTFFATLPRDYTAWLVVGEVARGYPNNDTVASYIQLSNSAGAVDTSGRFRGAFAAFTQYSKNDLTITPDGKALVSANANFLSSSAYVASDWTVRDAVLTPDQVKGLLPLASPVVAYDGNGTAVGYTTLDAALAAAGSKLSLTGAAVNVTATNTTSKTRPSLLYAAGAPIVVNSGVNFRVRGLLDSALLSGEGALYLVGGGPDAYYAAILASSEANLTVTVPASAYGTIKDSYVKLLTGAGTVYLYGNTVVGTIDLSGGLTVIERRPGAASGFAPVTTGDGSKYLNDKGTYTVPGFVASTYNRAHLSAPQGAGTVRYDAIEAGSEIVNGIFICPSDGFWKVETGLVVYQANPGDGYNIGIYVQEASTGSQVERGKIGEGRFSGPTTSFADSSRTLRLRKGDSVYVSAGIDSGQLFGSNIYQVTNISIYKIANL